MSYSLYVINHKTEGDTQEQLDALRKYFNLVDNAKHAEILFLGAFSQTTWGLRETARFKNKPLIIYCWDYYEWIHKQEIEEWKKYVTLLEKARLIIVPSEAQKRALKDLLGLESVVVRSGIKTYEHEISDEGFVLDPLRYYPFPEAKWAEQAGEELGIPVIHSEHQYNQEEFRKLVASCSFMTNCVPEASTGGLTLCEGLNFGKPSLVSDAKYQGASSYLKDFGVYFKYNDYEDFKTKFKEMWEKRPKHDLQKARDYLNTELSFDLMAKNICESILQQLGL